MTKNNRTTTVILIRHGECEGNREGLFRGRTNFPLNGTGREQARSLAEAISYLSPSMVFSSPLTCATETATIISERCGAEMSIRQGSTTWPWASGRTGKDRYRAGVLESGDYGSLTPKGFRSPGESPFLTSGGGPSRTWIPWSNTIWGALSRS